MCLCPLLLYYVITPPRCGKWQILPNVIVCGDENREDCTKQSPSDSLCHLQQAPDQQGVPQGPADGLLKL